MVTIVVNLMKERYDIYIGRAGKGEQGTFGNPVRVGKRCPFCFKMHNTKGSTLPCFEKYFLERIANDPMFRVAVLLCKGKRLGCFCAPQPCHGDIIKKWLDENT